MAAEISIRQEIKDTTNASLTKSENFSKMDEVVAQMWAKPNKTSEISSGDNEKPYGDVRTSKDLSPEEKKELHERMEKMKMESVKELGKSVCEALGFGDCDFFDSQASAAQPRIDTTDSQFSRTYPASPESIKKKFQELYKEKHH